MLFWFQFDHRDFRIDFEKVLNIGLQYCIQRINSIMRPLQWPKRNYAKTEEAETVDEANYNAPTEETSFIQVIFFITSSFRHYF